MRLLAACFLFVGAACSPETTQLEPDFPIGASQRVSGSNFLTPETLAQQNDDFENPGYLWVERGADLFEQGEPSCAGCHENGLEGVATRYPAFDTGTQTLINLEGRINLCRTRHQGLTSLPYESDELLSLTAFVAEQSRGLPISVKITPQTMSAFERGADYFMTRRGQLNLACTQCHDDNWGKQLRGDTISQGHSNGFPAYRFEWEDLGSLHRRLHDCDTGVRAEPMELGSQTYIDLEFYLAVRASGLELESPVIRR